ncbi:MAG: ComEC/Rec2 family competence protein [Patescibacteria group bacterium]
MEWLRQLAKETIERKSYTVLIGCFSFLLGVIVHGFVDIKINFFWIYNAALIIVICFVLFYSPTLSRLRGTKNKKIGLIFLGLFFLFFGFARFNFSISGNKLSEYWDKNIEISGTISGEPINKVDKQQLVVAPETINGRSALGGKILLSAGLYPKYSYGEKINFSCKLQEPKTFDDFDYAKYLSIQNIEGLCYWPEILISASAGTSGSPIGSGMAAILGFKNFLIEKLNLFFHEPAASFASGLVLGAKNSMPEKLLENFSRTGTMHIVAISGWNITFLGTMFMPFLFSLRIKRGQAFYVMAALIFLYAILVGFGASVFRAAVMGTIALLAQKTGRLNHAGRALLYGVSVMFLINPRLIYDIGFWLSATATFGLIYFSPIAEEFFGLAKIKLGFLKESLAATIAAAVFTLPVSAMAFGNFSIWSIFVNILILPFVGVAIPLILAALPLAILFPHLANFLFLPTAAILNYILGVVNIFSRLPFGYFNFKINFLVAVALYGALVYFTFWRLKQVKNEI